MSDLAAVIAILRPIFGEPHEDTINGSLWAVWQKDDGRTFILSLLNPFTQSAQRWHVTGNSESEWFDTSGHAVDWALTYLTNWWLGIPEREPIDADPALVAPSWWRKGSDR